MATSLDDEHGINFSLLIFVSFCLLGLPVPVPAALATTAPVDAAGAAGPYPPRPQVPPVPPVTPPQVTPSVQAIVVEAGNINKDPTYTQIVWSSIDQKIRLIGQGLSEATEISFTTKNEGRDTKCDDFKRTVSYTAETSSGRAKNSTQTPQAPRDPTQSFTTVTFIIKLSILLPSEEYYYVCLKEQVRVNSTQGSVVYLSKWVHQGNESWVRLLSEPKPVKQTLLPVWIQVSLIVFLLLLSGLFSGLNLGLMSLDKTELQIIEQSGSKCEKRYAKTIRPVREKGNFLLCTLLLGNVLVNNTLTILMDDLTGSGLFAIITATVGIVVFGEIVPQAICSRHGLAVGARTVWITRTFMVLTFPISYPVSLVLDKILGEEIGQVYNREKLQQLIRLAKDLKCEEVDIISGALALTKKTVKDAMTKMTDVFMLELNTILDFETVSETMKQGYTRVPVYDRERDNIVAILNIKDLALLDPDDCTPLKAVCKFYNHPVLFVFDDHKLDNMLHDFKQGHSHMAIVRRVNNEGDGDPYYETLGVITMEDVIEELIQSEIIDETDTVFDNRLKKPRKLDRKDLSVFNQPDEGNAPHISPQLTLACFQFLFSSVEPFKAEYISESVLKRLLKEYIVKEHQMRIEDDNENFIFREGQPCDFFILLLQGHVQVIVGKEKMIFDGGPFSYYGVEALTSISEAIVSPGVLSTGSDSLKTEPYRPDYSVKATEDLQYLHISRDKYIAARRATLLAQKRESLASQYEAEAFKRELTRELNRSKAPAEWRPSLESFNSDSRRASEGAIHRNNHSASNSVKSVSEATPPWPITKSVSSSYIGNLKKNNSHEAKERASSSSIMENVEPPSSILENAEAEIGNVSEVAETGKLLAATDDDGEGRTVEAEAEENDSTADRTSPTTKNKGERTPLVVNS